MRKEFTTKAQEINALTFAELQAKAKEHGLKAAGKGITKESLKEALIKIMTAEAEDDNEEQQEQPTMINGIPLPTIPVIPEETVETTKEGTEEQPVENTVEEAAEETEIPAPSILKLKCLFYDKQAGRYKWLSESVQKLNSNPVGTSQAIAVMTKILKGEGKYKSPIYKYSNSDEAINSKELVDHNKMTAIFANVFKTRNIGKYIMTFRQCQLMCPAILKDGKKVWVIGKKMHEVFDSLNAGTAAR